MGNLLKRGYVVHRASDTRILCDIVAAEGGDWLGWYVIREREPTTLDNTAHNEHLLKLEERMNTREYMRNRREIDALLESGIIFLPRITKYQ